MSPPVRSVAGLKKYAEREGAGEALVAVLSGANVNFDRIRHVAERAGSQEKRELWRLPFLSVLAFKRFCEQIGHRNITEFNYRFADENEAHIFVGVQQIQQLMIEQNWLIGWAADLLVVDMTDNELAKLHIRHMVGGLSPKQAQLVSLEFPERPGLVEVFE